MLAMLSCSRFCVRCTRRSEHAACEAHHETRVAQHTTYVMTCGMLCTAPAACAAQAHGLSIRRALCGCAAEALRVYCACAAGRRCTAVAFAEQFRAAVADAAERSRCEHTVSAPSMAISGIFAVGRCSRRSRCTACRWHATAAAGAGIWWESCLDVTCGWECMRLCLAVRVLVFGCVWDSRCNGSALVRGAQDSRPGLERVLSHGRQPLGDLRWAATAHRTAHRLVLRSWPCVHSFSRWRSQLSLVLSVPPYLPRWDVHGRTKPRMRTAAAALLSRSESSRISHCRSGKCA